LKVSVSVWNYRCKRNL